MHIQKIFETVGYRIEQSNPFLYQCFGMDNPRIYDYVNIDEETAGNFTADINGRVYEVIAEIPEIGVCYRWVDPEFRDSAFRESLNRGLDPSIAWDNIKFTEVFSEDSILVKVNAICNKIHFNNLGLQPTEISDAYFLKVAKMAAERDVTFNKMVEILIKNE